MSDNLSFIKIEEHIDIPCSGGNKSRTKYPFNRMNVSDSVFYEGQTTGGRAYLAACAHGRYSGKKFIGRTVEGGIRIWRVK